MTAAKTITGGRRLKALFLLSELKSDQYDALVSVMVMF